MTSEQGEIQCPTPTAHRRLEEAHKWWHGCLTNYDNIDDFRANLNAGIQALRNVTWMIQKERRFIAEFDSWYSSWQEKMKADPIMRWLVSSRNRIVKEGDLELNSTAIFRFVYGYQGAAELYASGLPDAPIEGEVERSIPPRTRPSEYGARMPYMGLPRHIWQDTVLYVQRRWVDRALPDRELLDALAHCYGFLSRILKDAHERAGYSTGVLEYRNGRPFEVPSDHLSGRLPCMATTIMQRTSTYAIGESGPEPIVYVSGTVEPPDISPEKSDKRYGIKADWHAKLAEAETIFDRVPVYMERAKKILSKDKNHISLCILHQGSEPVDFFPFEIERHADKMVVAQLIADRVQLRGADGAIIIGEIWMAPQDFDEDGNPIRAADSNDRMEALVVVAQDRWRNARSVTSIFSRRLGRIRFERDMEESGEHIQYGLLSVTRTLWDGWNRSEGEGKDDPEVGST